MNNKKDKKLKENKRALRVLKNVSQAIADENPEKLKNISVFEKALGITALPILDDETLEEVLDALGETPLEEPEIFELLEANDAMGVLKHIKALEGNENLDFESMDALTVSAFIAAVRFKVVSFTNKDGEVKSTPNTQEAKVLNFGEVDVMKKLYTESATVEEIKAKALELSGLETEKLTEWEKSLVFTNTQNLMIDVNATMLGGF